VNRWWKHLTAVSDGRLNDAHARIVLPIELHTKTLLLSGMGNLCSKFGKDRSINYATFLYRVARRTDGRTLTWFYILSNAYA